MLRERHHGAIKHSRKISTVFSLLVISIVALMLVTSFFVFLLLGENVTTQNIMSSHKPRVDMDNIVSAIGSLQQWYDAESGLWNTTGWWNSANALTTLLTFAEECLESQLAEVILDVTSNTYSRAQYAMIPRTMKVMTPGAIHFIPANDSTPLVQSPGFLNEYYDDEGWWALAWLKAYDLTRNETYLEMAMSIFEDLKGGWGAPCGGLWWDKSHTYKGAIENEIFFAVAAGLAKRVRTSLKERYWNWAAQAWNWFENSGLMNKHGLVNNGLDLSTCLNDNGTVWTYNQGVFLGGLVEMSEASWDPDFLFKASKFANSFLEPLSDRKEILHEICEPDCGRDGPQFKGIFMRNLLSVFKCTKDTRIGRFLEANADSIWKNDRSSEDYLGLLWSGPYLGATASTQSSALDALISAFSVRLP